MVAVHSTVGTLVLVAFLVNTVVYVMAVMGRPVEAGPMISRGAALIILIQWALGITLLIQGLRNIDAHYTLGLLTIVTVALEHSVRRRIPDARRKAWVGAILSLLTFLLALFAWLTGNGTIG